MKLCAVAFVLSCVISPVILVSPLIKLRTKACMGMGFVPVTCKEDLVASVYAGTDGAQGNPGKVGLVGPRGPKGDRSSNCDKIIRIKIGCRSAYDEFLKIQHDIRWMDNILHVLMGYDLDDLSKAELIKLVLTQNMKIVDDTTAIDVLDQKVTNLTKQVELAGKDVSSLTDQNKKLKDQVAGLPAKEKEIIDLKAQLDALKKTIHGSGQAVEQLAKAQQRLKAIEAELKSTSDALNAKIKLLEDALKIKTTENAVLLEKLKEATAAANNNAKVANLLKAENEKLKAKLLEQEAACKKNLAAKEAELDLLKKEIAALKLNSQDVEKQKLLIAKLYKQIEELKKAQCANILPTHRVECGYAGIGREKCLANPDCCYDNSVPDTKWCFHRFNTKKPAPTPAPPVAVTNKIYFSTDLSKPATTISDEDIGKFKARYVKDGKIVLPSRMGNDGTGPYMVIVNRFDGSQDFKKTFAEYQAGFGSTSGEFWLGLEPIHSLMKSGKYKLRVELTDHVNKKFYANYGTFAIGAAPTYTLSIGNFKGDTYDSMRYHNGQKFSALDKDQDATTSRFCAAHNGGWWYKRCQFCLLTGTYHKEVIEDKNGVRWYDRRVHGRYYSWKEAVMMMAPV